MRTGPIYSAATSAMRRTGLLSGDAADSFRHPDSRLVRRSLPCGSDGPRAYANFYTPAKAVLCSALVDITGDNSNYVPSLFCWTPNDGFTLSLSASRRPTTATLKRYTWHYEPGGRTLRFGQAWWLNRDGASGGAGARVTSCCAVSAEATALPARTVLATVSGSADSAATACTDFAQAASAAAARS